MFQAHGPDEAVWFQSQVAILGWGYPADKTWPIGSLLFQSQVAILGWGYAHYLAIFKSGRGVSIAGGDSWVGIRQQPPGAAAPRFVSIAGGDSWVGIPCSAMLRLEDTTVSIAGGDSWVGIREAHEFSMQGNVPVSIAGGGF